jgi:type II secretory pathway component GspD/PulD (secretin)
MNLVPHILDDNKLLLQYAVNLSSLVKLETTSSGGTTVNGVTTGGSSIQTPNIDTRNFLQRVALNSGDTLVVAGFEQTDLSAEQQGVGDAENIALGGSKKGKRGKTVIVVLLQPVIAN